MADRSDSGESNWPPTGQVDRNTRTDQRPSIACNQEQQTSETDGLTAQHGWRSSSPSSHSGPSLDGIPARQGNRSALDCELSAHSEAARVSSTIAEGAYWNPGNPGLSLFDGSSRGGPWPTCDTDGEFAAPQQLQTGATVGNGTARASQGGKSYSADHGNNSGLPDTTVSSQPPGSSSSSSAEYKPDSYPSGGWSSSGGAGRAESLVLNGEVLTPEMLKIIHSDEGWGTTPVRQDTPWPEPDNAEIIRRKVASNLWASPAYNGTAIWDSFRVNATGGASSHVANSLQDRRGSTIGDRSSSWPVASLGREAPSWVDSSDQTNPGSNSGNLLDVPLWGTVDGGGRNRAPGMATEARGASLSGQGSGGFVGSRDSPPGGIGGSIRDWNSRSLRPVVNRLSQPSYGEGLQGPMWNTDVQHGLSYLGPSGSGLSRQQVQPGGRFNIGGSGSPMQWEQPAHGRRPGALGSGQATEAEWDGGLGAGAFPWPPVESFGGIQRHPKLAEQLNRDEIAAEWAAASRRSSVGHGAASKFNGSSGIAHQLPHRQQMMHNASDAPYPREGQHRAFDNSIDILGVMPDFSRAVSISPHANSQTVPRALVASQDNIPGGSLATPPFQSYPGSNAQSAAGGKSFGHLASGRQPQPSASAAQAMPTMLRQSAINSQHLSSAPGYYRTPATNEDVLQGLESLINQGYISQSSLNAVNVGVIEEMVHLNNALQMYLPGPHSMQQLSRQQREQVESIKQKLEMHKRLLREPYEGRSEKSHMAQTDGMTNEMIGIMLSQLQFSQPQTRSKLAQWKATSDYETGVLSQASRTPGAKPLSTASGPSTSGEDAWSSCTPGRPKLDANHNESQQLVNDYDVTEFIPGQMWAGGMGLAGDDSNLPVFGGDKGGKSSGGGGWSTSSGIPRSISVPGGIWPSASGYAAASAPTSASSAAGEVRIGTADVPWSSGALRAGSAAPARPPPGLASYGAIGQSAAVGSGYGRRSSTSASWSPSAMTGAIGGHLEQPPTQWIVLHGPTVATDPRVKSVCNQHGTIMGFFPNSNEKCVIVQYRSAEEAASAHENLNGRMVFNSTIQARLLRQEEAKLCIERCALGMTMASSGLHSLSAWSTGASSPAMTAQSTWSTGGGDGAASSAPGSGGIHYGNMWLGGTEGVDGSCL